MQFENETTVYMLMLKNQSTKQKSRDNSFSMLLWILSNENITNSQKKEINETKDVLPALLHIFKLVGKKFINRIIWKFLVFQTNLWVDAFF